MTVRTSHPTPVASLADASTVVRRYVDTTGIGAASLPLGFGDVTDDAGQVIARVSYNGNVWPARKWRRGMKPLINVCN